MVKHSRTVRLHPHEGDRLDSLASYGVLDTPPGPAYDAVASLAARLCDAEYAAITLVDASRQWFKSIHGMDLNETPRELSFCSDVVAHDEIMTVDDATASPRHHTNPMVVGPPYVRSYAGVPLVGRDGLPLGALCVFGAQCRTFTDSQVEQLVQLSHQVVALLEQDRRDLVEGQFHVGVVTEARDSRQLRMALDAGEFVPFYQPVVDIGTGRPQQIEALLRWEHPIHGTLAPAAFLPTIEASAFVIPLGRFVLDAALARLAALAEAGIDLPGGVAVNVASGQMARAGLAADVRAALDRHHLDGSQLTVEITETTKLQDLDLAKRELTALRNQGVHVTVDDFGVGWSNLTRVRELPVDGLKIDVALAGAVLTDPTASAMVASTTALAKTLGLTVTAEGIETPETAAHLAILGCERGQGWLYSPAVAGEEIATVLRSLENGRP